MLWIGLVYEVLRVSVLAGVQRFRYACVCFYTLEDGEPDEVLTVRSLVCMCGSTF